MMMNFCYLKIICFLHTRYHTKIIEDILKNVQKKAPLFQRGYMINSNENQAENKT